jgi:two-component system, OmpR family, phosphate regulon response regulator PhoB
MSPESTTGRVLVVDDEAAVRTLLKRLLTMQSYDVVEAEDGPTALKLLDAERPDIVLLDVSLPTQDGLEVLAQIRKDSDVPVILVTARGAESDRVVGLRMGADDYVVKPFSAAELSARIESVLRRARAASTAEAGTRLEFGNLSIDVETREVMIDREIVITTAREFDLLAFLARSPRQVFSRQQLLEHVWDSSAEWQDAATVTEHIRRLRRKIEVDADNPMRITTVRGVGYRFEP